MICTFNFLSTYMPEELIPKHILSKSSFLQGCQCIKSLYLNKNQFDLKEKVSTSQQAVFDKGHEVGKLARILFPGGTDASPQSKFNYQESVSFTRDLLKKNVSIIYEAAFQHKQVLTAVDILVNNNGKFKIYEVKSSTEIKDINIIDAALQYYVLTKSGILLDDISIIFINNQYSRNGELDLKQLFNIESVKNKVLQKQNYVKEKIEELKLVATSNNVISKDIGPHCTDPYDCDFINFCWKNIPDVSIFDLIRLNKNKKFVLYQEGIIDFKALPADYKLSDSQKMQVDCYLKQKTYINKNEINHFVSKIAYPVYFMDFESFQSPFPRFDNSRPYQQIPFQFSLHCKSHQKGEARHMDFLAEANSNDPRIPFIKALLKAVEMPGAILVYNQSFEISILKQIAIDFPDFSDGIYSLISRIIDLMIPFSKQWYYSPAMNGKYSIKSVLPSLIPGMTYENLEIGVGGEASAAFINMYGSTNQSEIKKTRNNLKEYCKLDTFAMVKLLEILEKV